MRLAAPVLGLTLLMVLGCSGLGARPEAPADEPEWATYTQRIAALDHHRIHEALPWLGAPTRTEDLGDGATRHTWDWRGGIAGSSGFDCLTVLETDVGGRITKTHTEGPACVGVPPRNGPQDAVPEAPIEDPVEATAPGRGGGRRTGGAPAAPAPDIGPLRVHRAPNGDPLNGGSLPPEPAAP